jgi:hypothetical protein
MSFAAYNRNSSRTRKPAQQLWAVGEAVKVGFLQLHIVGKHGGDWLLTNKDGTKRYAFTPHQGLLSIYSFAEYCA